MNGASISGDDAKREPQGDDFTLHEKLGAGTGPVGARRAAAGDTERINPRRFVLDEELLEGDAAHALPDED